MWKSIIIWSLVVLWKNECLGNITTNLPVGADCFHTYANRTGVCQPLSETCEYSATNFANLDIDPQICGYRGRGGKEVIICCPDEDISGEVFVQSRFAAHSKSYCAQYATKVFDENNKPHCGIVGQSLIFGGKLAVGKEFPHMALVGYGEPTNIKWNCGGSLISDQWVMTAAHCLVTQNFGEAKFVRLGELNYEKTDDDADPQDFRIVEKKKHPNHTYKEYDDIGLLKLDRTIRFSIHVRPACLWKDRKVPYKRAIATGWGNVGFTGEPSPDLLKVVLSLSTYEDCNATFEVDYRLDKGIQIQKQICAGPGKNDDKLDTCPGDSGGPLQIYADPEFFCMYYVIGVTSFGKPCAIAKRPSVYTRVSYYLPWIESVIWP